MRIGINVLLWHPGKMAGIQTFLLNLISALDFALETRKNLEIFVFGGPSAIQYLKNKTRRIKYVEINCEEMPRWKVFLLENTKLKKRVHAHKIDLLHSVNYYGPLMIRCKHVITIHDVNFLSVPKSIPPVKRLARKLFTLICIKKAFGIATVSNFSKREIYRYLRPRCPVYIVSNAPNKELLDAEPREAHYNDNFILSVGSSHEHKNFTGLIKSYEFLYEIFKRKELENKFPDLVITGLVRSGYKRILETIQYSHLASKIHLKGYVDLGQLRWLYEHARVFAMPSLYEGFGIPVLEAMAFGCPVVSSNETALPEVVGQGGLLVNARSPSDFGFSLAKVLLDARLREDLIRRGYKRVKCFDSDRIAKEAINLYKKIS